MSTDITIRADEEISISDIITGAEEELRKLTGLNNLPPLVLSKWSKRIAQKKDENFYFGDFACGLISFLGHGEIVEFSMSEVNYKMFTDIHFIPKTDVGFSYVLSIIGSWKIKYLLAAGVILSISKLTKKSIEDDLNFFVPRFLSSYDEFLNDVRIDGIVPESFKEDCDLQALSEIFYNRLALPTKYRDMEKEKEGA